MSGPQEGLSIGELARRTGVPAATLRSWEDRYGFPRPQRLSGGHRRYAETDSALIEEILRLRASGMSLQAAIGQAASAAGSRPSVFAGLRRRHPGARPPGLAKGHAAGPDPGHRGRVLPRAERPALFAAFQQGRFFLQLQRRWNELARTARVAVVFADFGEPPAAGGPPRGPYRQGAAARAPRMDPGARLPRLPACVSGWEFHGQPRPPTQAGVSR